MNLAYAGKKTDQPGQAVPYHGAESIARLARVPEDLAAVREEGVVAAVWRRDLPDDVLREIQTLPYDTFGLNDGPGEKWLEPPMPESDGDLRLPPALRRDMREVWTLFARLIGTPKTVKMASHAYTPDNVPTFHDARETYQPHGDSDARFRAIVTYTPDPDLVTEWYPFTGNRAEGKIVRSLRDEQPSAIAGTKRRFGMQKDPPGSIMFFRALEALPALIHNVPVPKAEVLRLVYMVDM